MIKSEFWEHNCPVDGLIYCESDKECNWCGAIEEDEDDYSSVSTIDEFLDDK